MKFTKLELNNFRCYENRTLEFGQGFNLIIGNNARGKTTWLEALALGAGHLINQLPIEEDIETIFDPRIFVITDVRREFFIKGESLTEEMQFPCTATYHGSQGDQIGTMTGGYFDSDIREPDWNKSKIVDEFAKHCKGAAKGGDEVLPVFSYFGTQRLWDYRSLQPEETLSPGSRFEGYKGCFTSRTSIGNFLLWFKTQELIALQKKKTIGILEACRQALETCIPNCNQVHYDVERDEISVVLESEVIPFNYLSDGYRNMLAMVADIAIRCATLNPQLELEAARKTPGVVLIDEIDLHLHPKWQRQVVRDLIAAFPNIQFVATTHSPFVIQSLPPNQDVKLINLDGGELEDVPNRSVEDIVEWVQGVKKPQRSQRHTEMMERAAEYFSMLEDDSDGNEEARAAKREELNEAIRPFSDDPAYIALIRMQELAKEGKTNGGASLRRERKAKEEDSDDGDLNEGGAS